MSTYIKFICNTCIIYYKIIKINKIIKWINLNSTKDTLFWFVT